MVNESYGLLCRGAMNGEAKSECVWPIRNGPCDAGKAMEFSVSASKASHNEAVTIDNNSHIDGGNMVNGMQNGALNFNSKLTSTCSDADNVIRDLTDGNYAASKLAMRKKALPNLSCETQPNNGITDLPAIKEANYMTPPSSPMLMALRDAVSSLNRIEDFDIIEEIGEGFYAKVYKVRKCFCH